MKTMKAICIAAILALALSVPVYAGDMNTPGADPPPPPPPPESIISFPVEVPNPTTAPTSGDISTPGFANTTDFLDILWVLASIF